MDKRRMEDIKIEKGKAHRVTQSNHNIDNDSDTDTLDSEISAKIEKEVEDKIDKYINSRNVRRTLEKTPKVRNERRRPLRGWISAIFIVALFMGGIYFSSIIFEKAQIDITAKKQTSSLSHKQFTSSKDTNSNLGFEIMIMSGDEPQTITLTQTENVSVKSTGEVTLYNEFSKTSQNLVKGTFLSDEKGKTYGIDKAVTIPGYKVDKDNNIIPGTVIVSITAFLPGSTYDGSPKDFHIVGFKGTTKYEKIYAKANTSLTGGASGLVYVLSDKEKAGITDMANSLMKDDLMKKLKAEVPEGYIFYPGSIEYTYKLDGNNLYENSKSEVMITYSLSVVLLKKIELTKAIVRDILPNPTEKELAEISIPDLYKLSFEFVNKDQLVSKEMLTVPFTLTGDVNLVWNPNVENIRNKLVGITKSTISSIFNSEESIASANLKMYPPWQQNIPIDSTRIKINVQ